MGAGYYLTLGFAIGNISKFKIISNIPKNIRDFDRTEDTMIILLTDDIIIQIGKIIKIETDKA